MRIFDVSNTFWENSLRWKMSIVTVFENIQQASPPTNNFPTPCALYSCKIRRGSERITRLRFLRERMREGERTTTGLNKQRSLRRWAWVSAWTHAISLSTIGGECTGVFVKKDGSISCQEGRCHVVRLFAHMQNQAHSFCLFFLYTINLFGVLFLVLIFIVDLVVPKFIGVLWGWDNTQPISQVVLLKIFLC